MKQWKIDSDPFYKKLFYLYGLDFILQSGFFFDNYEEPIDIDETMKVLCTPIRHLKKPKTKKHCVLVSSGAMDPIHNGHISMMTAAKKRAEKEGYEVLGGYICPSHDPYVSIKNEISYSVYLRNNLVHSMIEAFSENRWIALDPWSGTFTKCDVNFTVIISRLAKYIKKYSNLETEIIYVCGEDRANFSNAFKLNGKCIVVGRPGFYNTFHEKTYALYASGKNKKSSSKIEKKIIIQKRDLIVRDDYSIERKKFDTIFKKYFNEIKYSNLEQQAKQFSSLDEESIISLDSILKGKYNIELSRSYDYFGCSQFGYHVKCLNLPNDLNNEYTLVDDDCVTGKTFEFVKTLLYNYGIKVRNNFVFISSREHNFEILDMRDFVIFGSNSGLVVNENIRVPYIYPFVDPFTRCSVNDPLNFSIDIWELNKEISENIKITNTIHFELYQKLGFSEDTTTHDICNYYIKLLKSTNWSNHEV